MPNSEKRPKITVEDLLRLKRAERPAAEFWTNFERELRQKQLAALLEKRPWWQELPQLFARRAYLPVGATAILAFTLVSVKYYGPIQMTQVAAPARSIGSGLAASQPVPVSSVVAESAPAGVVLPDSAPPAAQPVDDRTPSLMAAAAASAPAESAELMPAMIAPATIETPSSLSIAANLAHFEQSEPELVNAVMGSRLSPAARVQTVAIPATELTSVSTGAAKRSRILAVYNERPLGPEPTAPEIVRERLSRRLGDSEIADRISRIGLKGDQISLGLTLRL